MRYRHDAALAVKATTHNRMTATANVERLVDGLSIHDNATTSPL
jgi:hypothetical protein